MHRSDASACSAHLRPQHLLSFKNGIMNFFFLGHSSSEIVFTIEFALIEAMCLQYLRL